MPSVCAALRDQPTVSIHARLWARFRDAILFEDEAHWRERSPAYFQVLAHFDELGSWDAECSADEHCFLVVTIHAENYFVQCCSADAEHYYCAVRHCRAALNYFVRCSLGDHCSPADFRAVEHCSPGACLRGLA